VSAIELRKLTSQHFNALEAMMMMDMMGLAR
jgi:hypothetical protein